MFRPTYLLSGLAATDLQARDFYYLINTLMSIVDKVYVCIREKSLLRLARLSSILLLGVFKSNTPFNSINRQSWKRLTTRIIRSSKSKNTSSFICMSEEMTYHKLMASPIQYKLIKKIHCVG